MNSNNIRGALSIHRVEKVSFKKSHCGVTMKVHVLDANIIRREDGDREFLDGVEHEFEITLFSDMASDDLAKLIVESVNSLK